MPMSHNCDKLIMKQAQIAKPLSRRGEFTHSQVQLATVQQLRNLQCAARAHIDLHVLGLHRDRGGEGRGEDDHRPPSLYVRSAVYASLLPRLDMLKSLGLVWIPGVMAGMMVSGASPIYAGIYQFIIVAMILAASGLAGLVATLLMST
jgi:hypothetical protein